MEEHEVYSVIGDEGFERLVAAFYRQVPDDDLLGPIYPADDLNGAAQRLGTRPVRFQHRAAADLA